MLTRRSFMEAGGLAALGTPVVEIRMRSDALGSTVWFDPLGVRVDPGTTVRWVLAESVHSSTAYHPDNANHSLRIPEEARPWDSGILTEPGASFEVTLEVPGVYDYYCIPHEAAGMVGRIVVGVPPGPGTPPFDDFAGRPGTESWRPVPEAARRTFPAVDEIVRRGVVRRR